MKKIIQVPIVSILFVNVFAQPKKLNREQITSQHKTQSTELLDMSHEFSFASSMDSLSLKKLINYAIALKNSRSPLKYGKLMNSATDLLTALQKK